MPPNANPAVCRSTPRAPRERPTFWGGGERLQTLNLLPSNSNNLSATSRNRRVDLGRLLATGAQTRLKRLEETSCGVDYRFPSVFLLRPLPVYLYCSTILVFKTFFSFLPLFSSYRFRRKRSKTTCEIRHVPLTVFAGTWKLFFTRSTSVHGALEALRWCAIKIYYWHWQWHWTTALQQTTRRRPVCLVTDNISQWRIQQLVVEGGRFLLSSLIIPSPLSLPSSSLPNAARGSGERRIAPLWARRWTLFNEFWVKNRFWLQQLATGKIAVCWCGIHHPHPRLDLPLSFCVNLSNYVYIYWAIIPWLISLCISSIAVIVDSQLRPNCRIGPPRPRARITDGRMRPTLSAGLARCLAAILQSMLVICNYNL